MGVTYKLKDEVLQFIIQRKTDHPKISCQDISDEILTQFDLKVSKSSVHEALKQAGIVKPRHKKDKDVFEIPAVAKIKIMADMVKVAGNLIPPPTHEPTEISVIVEPAIIPIPPPENALPLIADPVNSMKEVEHIQEDVKASEVIEKAPEPVMKESLGIERGPNFPQAGAIVLSTIAQEMGLKSYKEFNSNDLEYTTHMIYAFKLIFNNQEAIFCDSQFFSWSKSFQRELFHPRFLPGAVVEGCDRIINNIKPLVINDLQNDLFNIDGLMAVELIDGSGKAVVVFDQLPTFKRHIEHISKEKAGNPIKYSKIIGKNNINSIESIAYDIFGEGFTPEDFTQVIHLEGFIIKSIQGEVLTLIVPDNYPHLEALKSITQQVVTPYQRIDICFLSNV